MLKIAMAQMKVIPGALEENFTTMCKMVEDAKHSEADLIVFPEMCISGILIGDRFLDDSFCAQVKQYNEWVRALSEDIGIVWGSIYQEEDACYNAAFFAYRGEWVSHENSSELAGVYLKHTMKNDYIYDDSRYFAVPKSSRLEQSHKSFSFKDHRFGLSISNDLWEEHEGFDLVEKYTEWGVKYILNIAAMPWVKENDGKQEEWIGKQAQKNPLPILLYVNAVGCQNTGKNVLVLDGGSCVFGHFGDKILQCNASFISEVKVYAGRSEPLNETKHKLLDALTYGIREFDAQMFPYKPKWVIGLSGGLDSCVSAALLVRALGSERVIGYNLATNYNSSQTIGNANNLAKALQIPLRNGNIEELVKATQNVVINEYGYEPSEISAFTMENVQARIRGHLLSTFAAIHNGVICNNGNKVEVALGYCTLYGDTIGALAVLGDLLKTDLFELSHEINAENKIEVIPEALLPSVNGNYVEWDMMPSAELKEKQSDPMKWFYHDALIEYLTSSVYGIDAFVKAYECGKLQRSEKFGRWLNYYGFDKDALSFFEDLEWVVRQMQIATFKRIQMPPILTLTKSAFGSVLRESQMRVAYSKEYQEIRERLTGRRLI